MQYQVIVEVRDESLASELMALDLPGVTVLTRLRAAAQFPHEFFEFIIYFADKIGYPAIVFWLGEKIKKAESGEHPGPWVEELRKIRIAVEKAVDHITRE